MDHWLILVMVVGHVVREKLPPVGDFSGCHDLVAVNVLLQGVDTPDVRSMEASLGDDVHNGDERLKHQWIAHGCG